MNPREQAIDLYNGARELVQTDPPMAYRMIASAVEADPNFAEGWSLLGAACADLGSLPASVAAYRTALRCPENGEPGAMTPIMRHRCLLNLGHRLINNRIVNTDRLDEAEEVLDDALLLGHDLLRREDLSDEEMQRVVSVQAFSHTNLSLIAALWSDHDAEMAHAESGFSIHPDPLTQLGLAFACLFQGQYRRGLDHFEARFPHKLPTYLNYPWPRWRGERVDRLFVACDQGLGDTLSFARFIEPASKLVGELVFSVQPELAGLLTQAFRGVPNVKVEPQNHVLGDFDAWSPVFSLPLPLELNDDQIRDASWPAIQPRPLDDISWKRKGAKLNIAIAWGGAPGNDIDMHRSIPVAEFLALREIPGVALYSVQVGERCRDLHTEGCAALIRDLAPWIRDARDTAGIMAETDVIVACESFVAHLAGAMGKRCFVLCSRFGRDWRSSPYLGEKVLWYPNSTALRQGDDARWPPVFARVVSELSKGTF